MKFKRTRSAFIFLILFLSYRQAFAQRNYFKGPVTSYRTLDPTWGADADLTTAATLNPPFFALAASLTLSYSGTIPAGVTTFIRVDVPGMTPENFKTLLTVTPYLNGNTIATSAIKVVTQYPNATYIAVTASAVYNSVRIDYDMSGAWFGSEPMKVYDAFFGNDPADCGAGWATSYASGNAASPVSSATNAVDADLNSYSTIRVQSDKKNVITTSQTIYFSNAGSASDLVRIYLSEEASFNKNVLGVTGTVQAFLDESPAGSPGTAILSGITQTGVAVPVDLKPNGSFNRITITISIPASNPARTYDLSVRGAQILPLPPVLSLSSPEFCADAADVISVSNPVSGLQYKWYEGTTPLLNPLPDSYSPTKLPVGQHVLSVTASKPGCPESSPATVTINVNPKPVQPKINPY